jgi:2-hydroxychromene-2-carboxylate isomerase
LPTDLKFVLTPGADGDAQVLKPLNLDLPEGSPLTGDKAYNDYTYEDWLREVNLFLIPLRKENFKRPLEPALTYLMARARKAIETTGRLIERLLLKHIHAVTARGFELKRGCFVIACALGFIV